MYRARSPIISPKPSINKVPLISSKPPLISKTPQIQNKVPSSNLRSPLISKTPLMKTPLIAKPPTQSKVSPPFTSPNISRSNERQNRSSEPNESSDESPQRISNQYNETKQSKHSAPSDDSASNCAVSRSAALLEKQLTLSTEEDSSNKQPHANHQKNNNEQNEESAAVEAECNSSSTTCSGRENFAHLSVPQKMLSMRSIEGMTAGNIAHVAANMQQQHFPHPLLSTAPTTTHHPLSSPSLHHPHHHHPHHHHPSTTHHHPHHTFTTSSTYSPLQFSPLSSLSPHLQASSFSSPLMPGPPPTPLLLGGVIGGFSRGMMGGLLGPASLALPQLRYSNFAGPRRPTAAAPTLQEQLAKAAAAARMSRPY